MTIPENTNDLISVIIPTYKNRGGLENSIDSVLKQRYVNCEIIVVDDNEPNSDYRKSTEKLMLKYVSESRVKYIKHEKNKNGAAARNTGIFNCFGKYIAFLDDDDAFLQDKLFEQYCYLENNPQYDAVYCLAQQNGKQISYIAKCGNLTEDILMLKSKMFTPTLMFTRKSLLTIDGFDESFIRHQDYELLLRFFSHGFEIGCVPKVLTNIGTNSGENIPVGKKLEELKQYFFFKFANYIVAFEQKQKNLKNIVFVRHYFFVFLSHIKHGYVKLAIKVFFECMKKRPLLFMFYLADYMKNNIRRLWR